MEYVSIVLRDLRLYHWRRGGVANGLAFVLGFTILLPFAIGGDREILIAVAPAMAWIIAMLVVIITIIGSDNHANSEVENDLYRLSRLHLELIYLANIVASWLGTMLSIVAGLLVMSVGYGLDPAATLKLAIVIGCSSIGLAAITTLAQAAVSRSNSGSLLVATLVFPSFIPTLIVGGILTNDLGNTGAGIYLLSGITLLQLTLSPLAIALIVRSSD